MKAAEAWAQVAGNLEGVTLGTIRPLLARAERLLGSPAPREQKKLLRACWVALAVESSNVGQIWTDANGSLRPKPQPESEKPKIRLEF